MPSPDIGGNRLALTPGVELFRRTKNAVRVSGWSSGIYSSVDPGVAPLLSYLDVVERCDQVHPLRPSPIFLLLPAVYLCSSQRRGLDRFSLRTVLPFSCSKYYAGVGNIQGNWKCWKWNWRVEKVFVRTVPTTCGLSSQTITWIIMVSRYPRGRIRLYSKMKVSKGRTHKPGPCTSVSNWFRQHKISTKIHMVATIGK
jgi:hypothetical protein